MDQIVFHSPWTPRVSPLGLQTSVPCLWLWVPTCSLLAPQGHQKLWQSRGCPDENCPEVRPHRFPLQSYSHLGYLISSLMHLRRFPPFPYLSSAFPNDFIRKVVALLGPPPPEVEVLTPHFVSESTQCIQCMPCLPTWIISLLNIGSEFY